jgi:ATP-binding cassette subfamily B protein
VSVSHPLDLETLGWPGPRLGEALDALGRRSGLGVRTAGTATAVPPAVVLADAGRLDRWVEAAAGWLGIEAEPVECPHAQVERLVARVAPALLLLRRSSPAGPQFLALLGARGRHVRLLAPDGAVARVAAAALREALCRAVEAPLGAEVERFLDASGMGQRRHRRRRARARAALLGHLLSQARVASGWVLRPAGCAAAPIQARAAGLARPLALLLAMQMAVAAFWLGSWWLLGQMTLTGRLDRGWLLAWLLLLLSTVPCRLAATALGGTFAIRAGAFLKRRLLVGALALAPDAARRSGIGRMYSQVLESQVVEQVGLAGGFLALTAGFELVLALAVLAAGAGGWAHAALLAVWTTLSAALGLGYVRMRRRWTAIRST